MSIVFLYTTGADERRLPQVRHSARDRILSAMLAMRVVEIEGVELRRKRQLIEELSLGDADFLVDEFDRVDCGVETDIEIECPECFTVQELDLPFEKPCGGHAERVWAGGRTGGRDHR